MVGVTPLSVKKKTRNVVEPSVPRLFVVVRFPVSLSTEAPLANPTLNF